MVVDENLLESGAHESIRGYVETHKKVVFASNPLYELIFSLPNLNLANDPVNLQVESWLL